MKKNMRLSFQKGDALAILTVLVLILLSAVLFFPGADDPVSSAEVYLEGKKVRTLDLSVDGMFPVSGEYTNVISVKDGKIAIVESDCPGEDCVHTGWISSAGKTIVCLPNRLEIRLTRFDDVDFVVR